MKEKILNNMEFVKYQADQLESMIKQRSHQRRILIKFIRLNSQYLRMSDRFLSSRSDSTLVKMFSQIVNSMEETTPN